MKTISVYLSALFIVSFLPTAEAAVRSGVVMKSGEIRMMSASRLQSGHGDIDCETDGNLAFRFTEEVSPDSVRLVSGRAEQGRIEIRVRIDASCGAGTASFEYGHQRSQGDEPGSAVSLSPRNPMLSVPLSAGATATVAVDYGIISGDFQTAAYTLFGDRITFIIDSTFGQASERRNLATINFLGQVVDPDRFDPEMDRRIREASDALNEACAQAEMGTMLDQTCEEIRANATTTVLMRRAANAFDANALTSVPRASGQGALIQTQNVGDRLETIRAGGGSPGMLSINGLSFNLNGQRFDAHWIPGLFQFEDEDRSATLFGQRWGAFVNGNISIGSRKSRGKESGFDFDSWGLTSGVDYRFDNGAVAGASVGFSRYQSDLDEDGGSLDGDTWSFQLFGSVNIGEDFYIDLTAGYARTDFDQSRVVDLSGIGSLTRQVAEGSTKTDEWSASIAANYRISLNNGLTITPYGQFYYADIDIGSFSEMGSVFSFTYPSQNVTSNLWTAGVRASRAFSMDRGILLPFADISWQYESGLDGYTVIPRLMGSNADGASIEINNPDRSFGRLDTGLSWVLHSGNQFFVSYSALLFDRDTTRHSLFVGARWEF
ncbi:MAG: autotransporter outer membrane beta-barrel domain-containing protein [Wenzhouxiangella sp.]|nr:autotransporter outer membrane beta-barrel domain-containing protein [Wenzhouxiangella sp.]TVR95847.1 MAG: autotransporter outer membrane beta-barrel domain-containing protein [Wenzhouxiangellaceae bacterium]